MRPCPAAPTSNLEGQRGLGCTQEWGRWAAAPRAGPQAAGRGQRPSQATRGRGTPAPTWDKGAGPTSLLQGTRSCKALPLPAPPRLQLTLGPCVRSLQRGLGAQGGGRRLPGQGGSGLSPPSHANKQAHTLSGMPPGTSGESQPGPNTRERCQRVNPGSETGAGPWPAGSKKEDGAAPAGATRGSPASRVSRTEEGEA